MNLLLKKLSILTAPVALLVLCVYLGSDIFPPPSVEPPAQLDYSDHPIYSSYDFSLADSVINIGLQPLYLPASWIFEIVRRDSILQDEITKLGLELKFFSFLKGADVNFYMQRGDLDAGVGGDMPALTMAATSDIVIPALVQHGFTSIVAGKPMMISGLRGKRIGYAYGSNAHFTVLDALASESMTAQDVELIAMETTQMVKALASGRIDAFSSWEPTPTAALAANPDFAVIHRSMSTGYLYFQLDLVDKHPQVVQHIVAAEVRALRALRGSSKAVTKACDWCCSTNDKLLQGRRRECTLFADPELKSTDLLGIDGPPFIPRSLLTNEGPLHREFRFLQAIGRIPKDAEWKTIQQSFDRTILHEILSAPATYSLIDPSFALGVE